MSAKFQSVGTFNSLHPTCTAMLEMPYPDPWTISLAEQRLMFQRHLRDISGPIPTIRSIETLGALGQGRQVPLTLYRPHLDGPLPLFCFIHGGGFVIGQHDQYHALCARIARDAGCLVASIGYGLSPETRFPKGVEDCQIAYQWLQKEAQWLGIDAQRLAIGGDSAGGNLSAALGILATQGTIPAPKGLWLIYPIVDFLAQTLSRNLFAQGYGLNHDHMQWYAQQYLSSGVDEAGHILASPGKMNARTAQAFPPSLIQTAGFDPLRDEARDMANLLNEHDRLLAYTCYEEMTHGFIHAFDLLSQAQMAVDEGTLWLQRLFR